jgi:phosphoribosylaminoimidazole-succinocarboxamide synthase
MALVKVDFPAFGRPTKQAKPARYELTCSRYPARVKLLHSGKVRDVYRDGDDIVLVASDRVSVFDVILPTPIPDKGKILTAMSLWWFEQLRDIVPNHVISTD